MWVCACCLRRHQRRVGEKVHSPRPHTHAGGRRQPGERRVRYAVHTYICRFRSDSTLSTFSPLRLCMSILFAVSACVSLSPLFLRRMQCHVFRLGVSLPAVCPTPRNNKRTLPACSMLRSRLNREEMSQRRASAYVATE